MNYLTTKAHPRPLTHSTEASAETFALNAQSAVHISGASKKVSGPCEVPAHRHVGSKIAAGIIENGSPGVVRNCRARSSQKRAPRDQERFVSSTEHQTFRECLQGVESRHWLS